jgi:hypothetical protein
MPYFTCNTESGVSIDSSQRDNDSREVPPLEPNSNLSVAISRLPLRVVVPEPNSNSPAAVVLSPLSRARMRRRWHCRHRRGRGRGTRGSRAGRHRWGGAASRRGGWCLEVLPTATGEVAARRCKRSPGGEAQPLVSRSRSTLRTWPQAWADTSADVGETGS